MRKWPHTSTEMLRELFVDRLLTCREIEEIIGIPQKVIGSRLIRAGIHRTKEQWLIVKKRAGKALLSSPIWRDSINKCREAKRKNAIVRAAAGTNKTGRGKVTCSDCKKERVVVHYDKNKPNGLICRKCSNIRSAADPAWREKNLAMLLVRNADPVLRAKNSGAGNWRWKGGITPQNIKERNSPAYKQWVRSVFKRDNFTCQVCLRKKEANGRLNAHHIKTWSAYPESRYDVNNGITSCEGCHAEIIHKGSWQNEPISLEEILQIQELVRSGALSLDWEEAKAA